MLTGGAKSLSATASPATNTANDAHGKDTTFEPVIQLREVEVKSGTEEGENKELQGTIENHDNEEEEDAQDSYQPTLTPPSVATM